MSTPKGAGQHPFFNSVGSDPCLITATLCITASVFSTTPASSASWSSFFSSPIRSLAGLKRLACLDSCYPS